MKYYKEISSKKIINVKTIDDKIYRLRIKRLIINESGTISFVAYNADTRNIVSFNCEIPVIHNFNEL
jgi:hypothetical protein